MNASSLPISTLAQLACLLEVTARKPGNVHRFRDFEDATYLDFILSAAAIGPVMDHVHEWGVGRTILEAVRRTREVTSTNTNLGILLLVVPLAAVPREVSLQLGVIPILEKLTVEDARAVYEAIRLVQPGGLGKVPAQDIRDEPTQTLRQVMALAADRDGVARQYANGFQEVFQTGVPALVSDRRAGEEAIIYCHLQLMSRCPDTLIARKRGQAEAEEAGRRAAEVLARGWPDHEEGQKAFEELDAWLRAVGHERNPGTTADLVTASLFAALRDGTMQVPMRWQSSSSLTTDH